MLDILEKLINEHGSSAILKERLQLVSDKYSLLEEKNNELTKRNQDLEKELADAQAEIESLKEELAKLEAASAKSDLHPKELEMLKLFFETNQQYYADDLAKECELEIGYAEYHIKKLVEKGLVHAFYSTIEPTRYKIKAAGRAYIVEHT